MSGNFRPFTADHAVGLMLVLSECMLVAWLARRAPRTAGYLVALFILLYAVNAYAQRWGRAGLDELLPLHLCDLILILAFSVCLRSRPSPLSREWLYLYGCGLSVFALLTPDLYVGFPHWRFFEFFLAHGLIFAAVTLVFQVHGLAARPGAPLRALAGLVGYTLIVGSINAVNGWNYGYVCRKPLAASPLQAMPAWPYYIPLVWLLAWLMFELLWLGLRLAQAFATREQAAMSLPQPHSDP